MRLSMLKILEILSVNFHLVIVLESQGSVYCCIRVALFL